LEKTISIIKTNISRHAAMFELLLSDDEVLINIDRAVSAIINSIKNDGKVLVAGNGGSAADAQHIAGELVGMFYLKRAALPALALSTDTSVITSIANDVSYKSIFSRQIEALGREKDIFIGISTSGNSDNIIQACIECKQRNIRTVILTGATGGKLKNYADIVISIPSNDTPNIQEGHMVIYHIVCELIESSLFKKEVNGELK